MGKIKKALILGVTSQDGAYLSKFLLTKGYKVFGTFRPHSTNNFWRLEYISIYDKIKFLSLDVLDPKSISEALERADPTEVYNFAAQSFVEASFKQSMYTGDVTGLGPDRVLEEIKKFNKKIRFYQASSSDMYGNEPPIVKTENTLFHPVSPYGIAKLYGYWMTRMYRDSYDMFTVNGILFNHESPIRGLNFVTRKITNEVAKTSLGLSKHLQLGNLSAKRDWGYAPEYVEGMWMMMTQKKPDDYILATGESHSISELVNESCKVAGISKSKIKSSKASYRPMDIQDIKGDYRKAKKKLGWKPKTKFKKLVKIMVEEDINRWERWLKKEHQPWDITIST